MLEKPLAKPKPTRRPISIRTQLIVGIGLILILAAVIALVGYQSLRTLQADIVVNLEQANRFRELSLKLENEFLSARQNEAALLASQGSLGFATLTAYVSSSRRHLSEAGTQLSLMENLAETAQDPELRGLLADIEQLSPLIVTYERAFVNTVNAIQTRSQTGGLETVLHDQMEQLESAIAVLPNAKFRLMLIQIRAEEQAYFSTGAQKNVDNMQMQITAFKSIVSTSSAADLTAGSTTLDPVQLNGYATKYLQAFNKIVELDRTIKTNTTVFQEVTTDINGISQKIDEASEAGLNRARGRMQTVALQTTVALGIATAAALGLGILVAVILTRRIVGPLTQLSQAARQIGLGNLEQKIEVTGSIEVATLSDTFNIMVQQLKQTLRGLERQVADRTRDLERRSAYLAASAEVSRAVSSILDTDQLVRQVVDLIREQFKLYYVGLFLVDEAREWAVLRAGTGEAGKKMLERGHRLKIGAGSMIGWSISNAQARIALEAESDAQRRATSELPDTRSEAALPLRSRGQVVGALTVQSAESRAFDNVTISILQTMADQVAVALDNARLLAESQAALEAVQRAYGKLSREAWGELLGGRRDLGFRSDAYGIGSAAHIWRPEMEQAMQAGRVVQAADNAAQKQALAIPIKIGDTTIGILDTYKTGEWGAEEIALLEQITDQLAIALDSARLYQETQRRAARERMAAEITDKMRRAVDMDALIQTTIQELAAALSTSNAFLQLTLPAADKDAAQTAGEPAES